MVGRDTKQDERAEERGDSRELALRLLLFFFVLLRLGLAPKWPLDESVKISTNFLVSGAHDTIN